MTEQELDVECAFLTGSMTSCVGKKKKANVFSTELQQLLKLNFELLRTEKKIFFFENVI